MTQRNLIQDCTEFLENYYHDEIAQAALERRESLWVDHNDLYTFDSDLAHDALDGNPERILDALSKASTNVDTPTSVTNSELTIRLYNLPETDIYAPGEIRAEQGGWYVGVDAILERVTSTADFPKEVAFECQRCGNVIHVPQQITQDEVREPTECDKCERKGPWAILDDETDWQDYAKLRLQNRPDASEDSEGKLPGYVLNDLIDEGGENGLLGRAGEPVTAYGIVKRSQKSGRGENSLLFDHLLEVRAIEFDRDNETVDVEEHRETFEEIAAQPNAVDLFAESIAPQLHATDAWEHAFEFAVAYLFGAPRVDLPNGPTYRGDLHFLMITDYAMGKSTFKEEIEAYSPKCLSKSTTALSSDVGLTAAAVKDDFGEGQWTIKPGLLVRANGGHLILDEIDKGPDELTNMNDALEGEQVVDIEKAGQSATYESRTALMALGNPTDGRFDPNAPIPDQLGINETLLSRFDGIVTMEDHPDIEQDSKVAETWGKAYTESQQLQYGENDDVDVLERHVPVDVGKAWIKYARENVNPTLSYAQFEELEEWYAEEVRQLNHTRGNNGEGEDMPVPATVRVLAATVKMSLAFARARLQDEVRPQQIDRAKTLGKKLVKQNWDGENFNANKNQGGSGDSTRVKLKDALDFDTWMFPDEIARETNLSESKVRDALNRAEQGKLSLNVEEKNGKWRLQ